MVRAPVKRVGTPYGYCYAIKSGSRIVCDRLVMKRNHARLSPRKSKLSGGVVGAFDFFLEIQPVSGFRRCCVTAAIEGGGSNNKLLIFLRESTNGRREELCERLYLCGKPNGTGHFVDRFLGGRRVK
uniref:Uncharacterized protein n=1 Tax=Sipha flava TaxID=143950 RepID=A0A2S2Q9D5_9HEMI